MTELLDIVDHNNQVTGRGTRRDVHLNQQRHRSSHCIVRNSLAQVFLQLRHPSKDNFPNCWDSSVAGHVNSGESYLECIKRECAEELGVATNFSLREIATLPASAENGWEFLQIFVMTHEGPFILAADEISDGAWYSVAEVNAMLEKSPAKFAGGFDKIWELYLLSC